MSAQKSPEKSTNRIPTKYKSRELLLQEHVRQQQYKSASLLHTSCPNEFFAILNYSYIEIQRTADRTILR